MVCDIRIADAVIEGCPLHFYTSPALLRLVSGSVYKYPYTGDVSSSGL